MLFVERVWPSNAGWIDSELSPTEPHESRIAHFKAQESLAALRTALFPED